MEKREILNRMISEGLIPVIRVTSAREAMDVADAVKEGGVSFIEITMSVQGAIDVIKELTQKYKAEIIMGADMVKVFPAAQLGGPEYIKAIRGPLPQILLVPTGGVNLQNAGAFIKAGATALGVGGELVDKKAIKEKKFHVITENTRAFLKTIREARG